MKKVSRLHLLPDDVLGVLAQLSDDRVHFASLGPSYAEISNRERTHGKSLSRNGTTFTFASFRENGLVFMPFLQEVDLTVTSYLDSHCLKYEDVFGALGALRVNSARKPLRLKLPLPIFYVGAFKTMLNAFVAQTTWLSIETDFAIAATAQEIICDARVFAEGLLVPIRSVVLTDCETPPDRTPTSWITTPFELGLESIKMIGVLTDQSIASLKPSKVKHLSLELVGGCNLSGIICLQKATPLLETLSLQRSNILVEDLVRINWRLWPHLHSLDLEYNFTLNALPAMPPLKSLNVMNTGIIHPLSLGHLDTSRLEHFACDMRRSAGCYTSNAWFPFVSSCKALKTCYGRLSGDLHSTNDFNAAVEAFKDLHRVTVTVSSGAFLRSYQMCIEELRKKCPNTYIKVELK